MKEIRDILRTIEERGFYPDVKTVCSGATPEVIIDGKKFILFSSNNYLGLSTHPKVIEASVNATQKYGTGAGASRLASGTLNIHKQLEQSIAELKQVDDAIVFSTGYMANLGTIPAIMDLIEIIPLLFKRKGIILSDELNHNSIIAGCKASDTKVIVYKHLDMKDLKSKLRKYRRRRKLIVTDGVFSMDGDIAPLPEIVKLAKEYNALVMVDEAHATGVLGENGAGTVEHFHLQGQVDVVMGTFSKALGNLGGYVAGNKDLIKFLRISARPYIFSTAMPPGVAGGVIAAIKEIQDDPALRDNLWKNVRHLKDGFKNLGFNTLGSETQIIPVLIGEEKKAMTVNEMLFEKGFSTLCSRWPVVAKNMARIRCSVMATHTKQQIVSFLAAFEEIGRSVEII